MRSLATGSTRDDQRHAAREIDEFLVRQATGQQDDALDAPAEQVVDATPLIALAPVAADEERGVIGPQQALLDPGQRDAVERAVDGLRHDADAHRLAARERSRHRVRHELQLGDGGFDGAYLRLADARGAVQDARNGARARRRPPARPSRGSRQSRMQPRRHVAQVPIGACFDSSISSRESSRLFASELCRAAIRNASD